MYTYLYVYGRTVPVVTILSSILRYAFMPFFFYYSRYSFILIQTWVKLNKEHQAIEVTQATNNIKTYVYLKTETGEERKKKWK